jgi:hypothetical protein
MSTAHADISQTRLMVYVTLMGIGMGLSIPSFLIAVQTTVERRSLGTATSTLQFSRSIGGTLGVSVMGAALSARLAANLSASGLDLGLISQLLNSVSGTQAALNEAARTAVANAINLVFVIAFVAALLGLIVTLFSPHQQLKDQALEEEAVLASMD